MKSENFSTAAITLMRPTFFWESARQNSTFYDFDQTNVIGPRYNQAIDCFKSFLSKLQQTSLYYLVLNSLLPKLYQIPIYIHQSRIPFLTNFGLYLSFISAKLQPGNHLIF